MPFVRQRTTRTGSISTTLIEAYRDADGRPRQRILASLHGEPDTLCALAKLAAQRAALREEKQALEQDAVAANQVYEVVTQKALQGHQYSPSERQEIDFLLTKRKYLLKRIKQIEAALTVIQRDGVIIKKHCLATPEQIQDAVQAYKKRYSEAEALVLGAEFALKDAKASLRRLSVRPR
jgi:hypothetical protein